jgi:cell division protein FtsL
MAPPSSPAVRRITSSRTGADPGRTGADPGRTDKRAPLRLVPSRRRDGSRSRFVRYLPVALVVVALLFVVTGQAMLANGQVRLTHLQQQLQATQARHEQQVESVSRQETPARIVQNAMQRGMQHPGQVIQLPYTPLTTPLATPNVTPAAQ